MLAVVSLRAWSRYRNPTSRRGVEGKVVVDPLVRRRFHHRLVGAVISDDGRVRGEPPDVDDHGNRVLVGGVRLDLLNVAEGEVVLEECVPDAFDAVTGRAHEQAWGARQLEVHRRPEQLGAREQGQRTLQVHRAEGFVDVALHEPLNIVLVGGSLAGKRIHQLHIRRRSLELGADLAGEAEVRAHG
jgi:hypothetical protein